MGDFSFKFYNYLADICFSFPAHDVAVLLSRASLTIAAGASVVRQVAPAMSFKRKFNTPTKMAAPGNDDDDDVTRRGAYDSRPSCGRASADYWSAAADAATVFPNAVAGTDFRSRCGLSPNNAGPMPQLDRERKTEAADDDAWTRQPEVDGDDDVMGNIRSVIGSASTLDEKQRVLSVMISQLQSLKQNLFQQKSNGVSNRHIVSQY